MSQYQISDVTDLYWAENSGFKTGRDPMGIQNSSIATYACLLPGLTNLTGHIRYYSLYCWLLNEYDKIEREKKSNIHQYNFIRRAELAIAFIMRNKGEKSVVGANFITQERYVCLENNTYDLADGGDYNSQDKYWAYRSGAFGQYYLGSLIYFKLVKVENERFYLHDKGKEVASAVRKSVDESIRNLFLECILDGTLSEEEIIKLSPFALNQLSVDSDEWSELNSLLTMQDDDGSSFRRETILLMLNSIQAGNDVGIFVKSQFQSYDKDKTAGAGIGWYFYHLCEALHYSIETILCYILNEIGEMNNTPVRIFLTNVKDKILSCLEEEEIYDTIAEWRANCNGDIVDMYESLKQSVKDEPQAVAQSINLLMRLSNEFEWNKNSILEFEQKNDIQRQRGILSEGLNSYITQYLSLSLSEYITTIINQVMNEHTLVALSKMGNNNADLRKYILEDGCLLLVEIRYPNETSPRILSLRNFLQDLKYLTSDNKLTGIAHNYINSYGKE